MTRKEMTSREKIGQLFMVGFMGTTVTAELASFIKEYKPGGVILFSRNLESVEQIVELTNDLQRCSPRSPLLISIDQEGGRVSRLPNGFTIFPPCEFLGRCNSGELAYAAAATIAKELKAVGINMNMARSRQFLITLKKCSTSLSLRCLGSGRDRRSLQPLLTGLLSATCSWSWR